MKGIFMRRIAIDLYVRILTIIKVWQLLRPGKRFAGMSLEEFGNAVAPSREARGEVAAAELHLKEARARLKDADVLSRKTVQRVVNAVRADGEEGEDGELYSAMGYVPRSVRNSLRSIRRAKDALKPTEDAA
jgi:hypothetical protein